MLSLGAWIAVQPCANHVQAEYSEAPTEQSYGNRTPVVADRYVFDPSIPWCRDFNAQAPRVSF